MSHGLEGKDASRFARACLLSRWKICLVNRCKHYQVLFWIFLVYLQCLEERRNLKADYVLPTGTHLLVAHQLSCSRRNPNLGEAYVAWHMFTPIRLPIPPGKSMYLVWFRSILVPLHGSIATIEFARRPGVMRHLDAVFLSTLTVKCICWTSIEILVQDMQLTFRNGI